MTTPPPFELLYIGRSRLQRNRANLIQTLHTAAAFAEIGAHVRLYLPPWPPELHVQQRIQDLGIRQPLEVYPVQWLHSRWRRWRFWPFVRLEKSSLRRADALYTRSAEISAALAATGLAHALEIHDVRQLQHTGLLARIVAQHRAGVTEWLLPISRAAAAVLLQAGAVAERVHVSPSGVDLDAYAHIPAFDAGRLDRPRVVYVGRTSVGRGAEIFRTLAARGVADVTLVGEQEDGVDNTPTLKRVSFVPHREVPMWYGRSDLVLLPYQRGLAHADSISPLKLFEALAAGRPIIASDLPPIREILAHEQTALLVAAEDINGWIEAIERLRRERGLARMLAAAARALAAGYSWRKRAEGIAKALGWPIPVQPTRPLVRA